MGCVYICVFLLLACLHTAGSELTERSSLQISYITDDYVQVIFYQFSGLTSATNYLFQLQYRNTSSSVWIGYYSFSPYISTSVRSRSININGLKSNTEYAVRVVLKRRGQITWQTSTLIVQTKPIESSYHENRYYLFSYDTSSEHQKKTFTEAQQFCASHGGNLASILSSDGNDFVKSRIPYLRGEYWIGLQFSGKDPEYCNSCRLCHLGVDTENNCNLCDTCRNEWSWTDGSPMVYQNWEEQQPNDDARCAIFNVDKKWYDASCDSEHYFVCAKVDNCQSLDELENGNVRVTYSSYGPIAQYSCQDGYRLVGEEHQQCYVYEDNAWSGETPNCIEDNIKIKSNSVGDETTSSDTSPQQSASNSGEVLAIALFVVAVVVVIAGGGIMLFLIFRWINGLPEKIAMMEKGNGKKTENVYMNKGFKGAGATSTQTKKNKKYEAYDEAYEDIKK